MEKNAEKAKKATIYDIIVVPSLHREVDPAFFDLESKIMQNEVRRYLEFAKSAENSGIALSKILPLASKYKIAMEI